MASGKRCDIRLATAMKLTNRCRDDVTLSAFEAFRSVLRKPSADFKTHLTEIIDPSLFSDPREFLPEYWAVESFSKTPIDIGVDRERAALTGFLEAEDLCKAVTSQLVFAPLSASVPESLRGLIRRVQRRIKWLVSDICPMEVIQRARWSGGATSSLSASLSNPQNKWGLATHTTSGTTWWLQLWNSKFCDQAFRNWEVVECNRVLTVPKNAKTDRVIAAEPDWNMFFQLGMGACIRRRLQRVGLLRVPRNGEPPTSLTEAQTRQKYLARVGSRDGSYATIDLKAASDSISLAVCELLLPPPLFRMLCQLRSPKGELPDGTIVTFEKISSMGNGYTFELETLLFWAISCEAAGDEDVHVYGDDIIVPTRATGRVVETLAWFGFTANPKKTHTTGFFRESCGGHYFNGVDVTPPYFRKNLDCLTAVIAGYNSLCQRVNTGWVSPVLQRELMDGPGALLRRSVPKQLWGPPGLDGCLGVPFIEFVASSKAARAKAPYRNLKRTLGHASGLRFVSDRRLTPAVPEWGLTHSLYGATEGSQYSSPATSYKVRTWSSEPWSSSYPF